MSIVNDSLTFCILTQRPYVLPSQDSSSVCVIQATKVPISDYSSNNQPNGWVQLAVPAVVALIVLLLDKFITRWFSHKDERKARKIYRETVLDWITSIQPTEKTFSNQVRTLANSIEQSDEMLPEPFSIPVTIHGKLNYLTIEGMTNAFLRDYKNKDERYANMYNIISQLEFLSIINEKVQLSYNSYNQQSFNLCKEWNYNYELFADKLNTLPPGNPYLSVVDNWLNSLQKQPNSISVHIKYLEELISIAISHTDNEVFSILNKMRHVVQQCDTTKIKFAEHFKETADRIDTSLETLLKSGQFLRD